MEIKCYIITHKGRPCRKGSYSTLCYSNAPTVFFNKRLAEATLKTRGTDPSGEQPGYAGGNYVGRGQVLHLAVKEVTLTIPE